MATVTLHSKSDAPDQATIVTTDNFRAWKKKQGQHTAFVVQRPEANDEDDGVLVCTLSEMRRLPTGQYQARLVRRCEIADPSLKKQLRGSDVWREDA